MAITLLLVALKKIWKPDQKVEIVRLHLQVPAFHVCTGFTPALCGFIIVDCLLMIAFNKEVKIWIPGRRQY